MVPGAFPAALTLIDNGVFWRWNVSAEAFSSVLNPSIGIALILLDASFNAPGYKHKKRGATTGWGAEGRVSVHKAINPSHLII